LIRALYGLRRSLLLWYSEFTSALEELGLYPVPEADCLYMNNKLIVFFYVDDIAILCRRSDYSEFLSFKTKLFNKYEMRDLGELSWFLGIRIIRDRTARRIWLSQDSYIDSITKRFHLDEGKTPNTPIATDELVLYSGKATDQEVLAYQQKVVGSILYATICQIERIGDRSKGTNWVDSKGLN
jgi:hypothetical protein